MTRAKIAFYWNTLTRLPEVVRFRRNQSESLEKLLEIQIQSLRRRLMHAWATNPFYRDRMHALNLDDKDIRAMTSIANLEDFPVISKRDFSAGPETVLSGQVKVTSLIKSQTAGSTGRPLIFYLDDNERFKRRYVGVRNNLNLTGCHPEDTLALLSHFEPIGDAEAYHVYRTKWFNRVFLGVPKRVIQISPYRDISHRREILERLRPEVIQGSVWDLWSLARNIKSLDGSSSIRPRVCLHGMGWLPDYMIDDIRETLHADVRGIYGSREFGDFAAQCKLKRYHISVDTVVVESVDDRGRHVPPGTPGRLLITDLYNYATPFIRYEIGDVGVLAPVESVCECGCTLPFLERVEGRVADFVITTKGERVAPSFFWNEWRHEVGLEEAQLVQLNVDYLRLSLIVNEKFNADVSFQRLRDVYTRKLGGGVRFEFELVKELERETSGKIRMVKSSLSSFGQGTDAQ